MQIEPSNPASEACVTESTLIHNADTPSVDRRGLLGLAGLAGVAGMALLAGKSSAGPLTPPAGPITSTGKTLTEVEPRKPISAVPFIITQPGSYYLTSDLQLASTTADLITISADNVTIDLNGYTLRGGRTGIFSLASLRNVVIRNGAIQDSSGSAIFLPAALRANCSDLNIANHVDAAIAIQGQALLERISSIGALTSTTSSGLTVGPTSRLIDCTVQTVALDGITSSATTLFERCQLEGCGRDGIVSGEGSTLHQCSVRFAGDVGFRIGASSIGSNLLATEAQTGFVCSVDSVLDRATARSCFVDGFRIEQGRCTLRDCQAIFMLENGFNAINSGSNTFERCIAKDIELNAFQIAGGSVLRHCQAQATGNFSTNGSVVSSGVLLTASDNIIENCRFLACGYPVFIATGALRNTIFANYAIECTNTFTNNGGPSNIIATIRNGVAPVNIADNFFLT